MAIDLKPPMVTEAASVTKAVPGFVAGGWLTQKRVGIEDRVVFTERLALLLQTGVSLLEALTVMQHQTEQPAVAAVITALAQSVNEGKRFSVALASHPEMFSSPYISLVGAAEEGGFLGPVLEQLQQIDEKNLQLRSTLLTTLSYPAFLVVFSVAVVVFILVVIFPKFEDLFSTIRNELPPTTVALLAMSRFLLAYWPFVLGTLAAALWGLMVWVQSPRGVIWTDRLKTRLPVIGELYIKSSLVQIFNVLGLSLTNGVPVIIALRACQDAVDNSVFSQFIETVRNHVNEGRGISIGFRQADFIPPMVKQMIATGEDTGNLGVVILRVANFYEKDISKRVVVISKSIEPIMLLVMGVIVGLIVASLILPIFKLSRAAG